MSVAGASKEVRKMENYTMPNICLCCMEKHKPKIIVVRENNIFKGVEVWYDAEYFYCDRADETYADERQITLNHQAMKRAYEDTWKQK